MTEVISLINEKGGVGKSTSAITIAQILAISEYKILLIDLDPQMNTTKMYGQAEANPDIDYERLFCEKQNNKDEVMNYITNPDIPRDVIFPTIPALRIRFSFFIW